MIVIPPLTITDSNLTDLNLAEPAAGEPPAWLVGTTYAADDTVYVASTHRIYTSVQGSNLGNDPTTDDGTWWIETAPTNAWAMFDNTVSTQSSGEIAGNLVTAPDDFSDASWGKFQATISTNVTTDPAGTSTADKIVEDATASTSHYIRSTSIAVTTPTVTTSYYLKAAERTFCQVRLDDVAGSEVALVSVDLSDGSTSAVSTFSGASDGYVSVIDVGSGWYQVALTVTMGDAVNLYTYVLLATGLGVNDYIYSGDASSGLYVWGGKLEEDTKATQYNTYIIDATITPGVLQNSVALINMLGDSARVKVTDPTEGIVYDTTVSLVSDSGIVDWYAYYFTSIEYTTDYIFDDLPAYSSADIRVQVISAGTTPVLGAMVLGSQYIIGTALHGTSAGIINYDRKTTDSFGNTQITSVGFSKRAEYDCIIETGKTAEVQNVLADTRGTAAVWIGNADYGATIVYGFFKDFSIILSDAVTSDCNIQVEGLI